MLSLYGWIPYHATRLWDMRNSVTDLLPPWWLMWETTALSDLTSTCLPCRCREKCLRAQWTAHSSNTLMPCVRSLADHCLLTGLLRHTAPQPVRDGLMTGRTTPRGVRSFQSTRAQMHPCKTKICLALCRLGSKAKPFSHVWRGSSASRLWRNDGWCGPPSSSNPTKIRLEVTWEDTYGSKVRKGHSDECRHASSPSEKEEYDCEGRTRYNRAFSSKSEMAGNMHGMWTRIIGQSDGECHWWRRTPNVLYMLFEFSPLGRHFSDVQLVLKLSPYWGISQISVKSPECIFFL